MKHALTRDERTFIAKYVHAVSKRVKSDRTARKLMSKLVEKMVANRAYVTLSNTEFTFLLNMCKGGAELADKRLAQVRSLSLGRKVWRWCAYRKMCASLTRVSVGHKALVEKLCAQKKAAHVE